MRFRWRSPTRTVVRQQRGVSLTRLCAGILTGGLSFLICGARRTRTTTIVTIEPWTRLGPRPEGESGPE